MAAFLAKAILLMSEISKPALTSRIDALHWFPRFGIAIVFLILVLGYVTIIAPASSSGYLLIFAAVVGGYMAMNIGANDVANNVGPAVGSRALTLGAAIIMAAVCEAAGAIIAGGEVVSTIKSGIINPDLVTDPAEFMWLMAGALLAGALWLNFATWIGAPVSTTHSIVGGVLGAGLAAGGMHIANWGQMGAIAASWIISPVMGGIIAASLLMFIKKTILYQDDVMEAARKFVPGLVALMAWAFSSYLLLKGLTQLWNPGAPTAFGLSLLIAAAVYQFTRKRINAKAKILPNNREEVNALFTIPLIFAAGLLSFAHGANDVANAIGPLAAIADVVAGGDIGAEAVIPLWVLLVGALGLAVGLALFGPKLIRTVGGEITELDRSRAYCIAMAAAVTVIIASQLGLPVSSTHIALGGVFGVGFLREYLKTRYASELHMILDNHTGEDREKLLRFLRDFHNAPVEEMQSMLKLAKVNPDIPLKKRERKRLKKIYRQELVKRHHLYKIVAAWIITVPASACLGAMMYFMLRGMLLAG